ncbi:MAG: PAS domain-containing protein [Chloroflexi bacterium]|nr:PAS domain-containing protein [Chloroflexota bacterium]
MQGLEMGADGYLLRPITNRELVARVQAMMRIKAAEDALRGQKAQLRDVINGNIDGMLVLDLEGRVLLANPAACEMLNRSPETIIGQNVGIPLAVTNYADMDLQRRMAVAVWRRYDWRRLSGRGNPHCWLLCAI